MSAKPTDLDAYLKTFDDGIICTHAFAHWTQRFGFPYFQHKNLEPFFRKEKKTYKFEAPKIRIHEDEMRALLSDSGMARTKLRTMDPGSQLFLDAVHLETKLPLRSNRFDIGAGT